MMTHIEIEEEKRIENEIVKNIRKNSNKKIQQSKTNN